MEIGIRFFGTCLKLLTFLTWPLFYLRSFKSHKKLPPIKDAVLKQSATRLACKIRLGELKSVDVVTAFISRIEQVNPQLNAIVENRYAAALDDAKAVDLLVASQRKTSEQLALETPFLGVPFTVKESCGLKGMSYAVGSKSRQGTKSVSDGEAVMNLRKSGAIPIAVTNTPELCLSWECHNMVTGMTKNPYDQNRTSGGSSGGEAAILGAGGSVIGVGSDIAGSIRIPALYNGVYGHKPSPGVVALTGHYPYLVDTNFQKFLAVGPMCRYAEDLKPLLKVMASKQASKLRLDEKVDFKKLKVFYMESSDGEKSMVTVPVDPEIRGALLEAVNYLREEHGVLMQQACIKELQDSMEISCSVFFGLEDVPNLLADPKNPKKIHNIFLEILKCLLGLSEISIFTLGYYFLVHVNVFIPKYKYADYWKQNEALKNKFVNLLKNDGVFLYPTFPVAAVYHYQSLVKTAGVLYAMIFNTLGLPSTHVPLGLNKQGLPIGIQVVAAPNEDRLCLAVAEELEKQFGGWIEPPSPI